MRWIVRLVMACSLWHSICQSVSIAMIGTGYVGLVTGACLSSLGHRVHCVDIDHHKITMLNARQIPIYEPGLEALVHESQDRGLLTFGIAGGADAYDAQVIMIAVDTPMGLDGSADMKYIRSAIDAIIPFLDTYKVICIKSTVPVGTCQLLYDYLASQGIPAQHYDIVSNPEFLREGNAVHDFLRPDRIVIGCAHDRARALMQEVYAPLIEKKVPLVSTDWATSELIKYAANAFLATKVSFINEIAQLCDAVDARIQDISYALGLDPRIGPYFLNPGPGFGGSCFPKDCYALVHLANYYDVPLELVRSCIAANERQQRIAVAKLLNYIPDLSDKTVAVLGLAFKAQTDDVRHSPALTTLTLLREHGAQVQVYDPVAQRNMSRIMPDITCASDKYQALVHADALIIMTEWPEFKELDSELVRTLMRGNVIIDARNILDGPAWAAQGFIYEGIGCRAQTL